MTSPLDRRKAWRCATTNQLVMPGLGSLMANRRAAGYGQAGLAAMGLLMQMVFLIWFSLHWSEVISPMAGQASNLYEAALLLMKNLGGYFWLMAGGLALFILSWLWALITSFDILREAKF
jgi:hypothetical protein